MYRIATLGLSVIALGGCALPVPLQIASWALDGISVLTTQKSVTDHGISMIAQQDCAVWRGVTEGEMCRDLDDSDVLLAGTVAPPSATTGLTETAPIAIASPVGDRADDDLSSPGPAADVRRVRAVPTHALRAAWADKSTGASAEPKGVVNSHALRAAPVMPVTAIPVSTKPAVQKLFVAPAQSGPLVRLSTLPVRTQSARVATENPRQKHRSQKAPTKGIYFVIGSFRNPKNARRLVRRNKKLSPAVLNARLGGAVVYRVVVGPVPRGREKRLHRALARDGFPDTWAIRVNPSEWQFAMVPQSAFKTGTQLATLQK